jgi:quercetin dioxygenase-like cupin family protein
MEQSKSEMRPAEVVAIADLVSYQEGSVISRTLVKRATGTITLFAFDEGEGLSEHTAAFAALVQVLEGEADVTVAGQTMRTRANQSVLLPANVPHALKAVTRFKMLLTMIRS